MNLNNKLKKIFENKDKMSKNAQKAFESELILKALYFDEIKLEDVLNITNYGVKALQYPTIQKCIAKKMKRLNVVCKRFSLKRILNIQNEKALQETIKESQIMLKRSPFALLMVPTKIHDEIHEKRQQYLVI